MKEFFIGKTKIGGNNPCFIVAEIGINFDGKLDQAFLLIDEAKTAGCDAVKFQLFKAEKMYTKKAGEYLKQSGEKGDIFKLVKTAEMPSGWIPKLKEYAENKGLEFFSTACDQESVDILEKYGVCAYKIASYEMTHEPLVRYIARKKKPVIFSCGASTIEEIENTLKIFKEEGNDKIALLHCIAKYPAPLESLNLNTIAYLKERFERLIIGYSDHSLDPVIAPSIAVYLGAKVLEKHITLDRNLPGRDHYCAINPKELSLMVKAIRETENKIKTGEKIEIDERVLGKKERKVFKDEEDIRSFAYRCIFAKKNIKKGELLNKDNIAVLRTGNQEKGLEPRYYDLLINGCVANKDITEDKSINKEDVILK